MLSVCTAVLKECIAALTKNCRYTVAYTDFFDQEVQESGGDWKQVVERYLYSGKEPFINGFSGGCK